MYSLAFRGLAVDADTECLGCIQTFWVTQSGVHVAYLVVMVVVVVVVVVMVVRGCVKRRELYAHSVHRFRLDTWVALLLG